MSPQEYAQVLNDEGKVLLYCKTCKGNFYMSYYTWHRFNEQGKFLGYINKKITCCYNPYWLFVTEQYDNGEEDIDPTKVRSWKEVMKEEFYIELLGVNL